MDDRLALVGRVLDTFNRDGWAGLFPLLASDFEFHEPPEQPGATVFRGIDEFEAGVGRWAETWEQQTSEPGSVEVLPDGRVFAMTREHLRGRDGLEVDTDCWHVVTLTGSQLTRWQCFWDGANARRAAGLEPA